MKRIIMRILCVLGMLSFAVLIYAEEEFDTDAEFDYSYNEEYDENEGVEESYSEYFDSEEVFYDEEYDEQPDEDIEAFIPEEHKSEDKENISDTITVFVNDEPIRFDVEPAIINDRTMVPMRAIFEALGADVGWEDSTKTATGTNKSGTVRIKTGENYINKNGIITPIDSPAVIIDGRMLVPVRAIAESFECDVQWDGTTKRVNIIK